MDQNVTSALLPSLSHPLPFDRFLVDEVSTNVTRLLEDAQAALRSLEETSELSPAQLVKDLDAIGEQLEIHMTYYSQLESLLGDPELRAVMQEVQPQVSAFYATIPFSRPLYQHLQEAVASNDFAQLPKHQQRYLIQTLESFQRNGADVDNEAKARLESIERTLSKTTLRFAQHVVEETDAFEWVTQSEADLAGLPLSAQQSAAASAEAKGIKGWRFTLQAPSYLAIMMHSDRRDIRELFYRAYTTRASSGDRNNASLISEILSLRAQKAHLLGYQDISDLLLASRMVKSGLAARSFVDDLITRTETVAQAEQEALSEYARDHLGWEEELQAWDITYLAEKLRKRECDFDEELLKPYFEVHGVMRGMFSIVEQLYGVHIHAADQYPTWHADVLTFELHQGEEVIGMFYADLFPREGKQGGAWMCPLLYKDKQQPHVGLICANFSPPLNGRACLTHQEVETLFHEFGHLLHHLLTKSELRAQAGTNVAWDFVELPSQIMENWCWEREALDLFARHWETGDPLPSALFERLMLTRTFRAATAQMRQLCFAEIDLKLHQDYQEDRDGLVLSFAREQMAKRSSSPLPEDYAMIASFTHLFASSVGYASAYYSYKWAEVLDADAFTRFKREGLFSADVGSAFLDCILSQGDREDPAVLFQNFMGRPPSHDALFNRLGLDHRVNE